jgi:hypothetical protein
MHSPLQPTVYPSLGTPPQLRRNLGSVSHDGPANVSAKSESPFAFSGCYTSKGDVYHHLHGRYPTVFAPTGSCARSIALSQALLLHSSCGSLPVAVGPGWTSILPNLISANPSLDVWPPTPAGPKLRLLVSSLGSSAFPKFEIGRLSQPKSARRLQCGLTFRGCRHSLMFRPPGLLATLVAPTTAVLYRRAAVTFTSGHRAVSHFPHSGYATRLNRAIDGRGLSPPRFAALSAAPQTL